MSDVPKMLETFSAIEEELKRSFESMNSVSEQVQSLRDAVETLDSQDATETQTTAGRQRRVSVRGSSPVSPKSRVLQEPPALVIHRHTKAHQKTSSVSKTVTAAASTKATDAGGTQLRLHGRWMDLATQSAEGPTKDSRKKVTHRMSQIGGMGSEQSLAKPQAVEPLHPHGAFRICWDMMAMILIFCDTIMLPLALAWEEDMSSANLFSVMLYVNFCISLTFWTADLLVNMNTATYRKGTLVTQRFAIFTSYLRGWLLFDILLLGFDVIYVTSEANVSSEFRLVRVTRILRLLRLLRMLKLTRLNAIIEETAANSGKQWVTVVIAITNTALGMIFIAHLLTCMWYGVGRAVEIDNFDNPGGIQSWTVRAGAKVHEIEPYIQYLHAMRWIVNTPSPPDIDPGSATERIFDILVSIFYLLVMGSAISKISGTIAELRAMNEARDRRRREVRQYLSHQHVSFELVSRIMRFVDYRLEKFSASNLDTSLISPTLQLELYVGQRACFVLEMPIFKLLQECYHDVFGSVCAALEKHVYEKGENIFVAGSWTSCLHITATGYYSYVEGYDAEGEAAEFNGTRWFGELSLYTEGSLHQSTLAAASFAETFTLTGPALADCVKQSRGCMAMFCDFAKDFVTAMQGSKTKCGDQEQVYWAEECCKRNQHYQELYPDPKTRFKNITIPLKLKRSGSTSASGEDGSSKDCLTIPRPRFSKSSRNSKGSQGSIKAVAFDSDPQSPGMDIEPMQSVTSLYTRFSEGSAEVINPGLESYLKGLDGEKMETYKLIDDLQTILPELHSEHSPHVVFEQAAERERAESACISILALYKDRYDIFTQPQAPPVRMQEEQWIELQRLIAWIEPDHERIHAVLVLLAIRALGKSKAVLQQMPRPMRRPERAVLQLMESERNVVPSVLWLSERAEKYIENALEIHELFNLAQMLQGENLPANIGELRRCIEEKGEDMFRFYILFLLGFMSGIAAGTGSRFMNGKNASAVISGIRLLQRLMEVSPQAIYWGYLEERAEKLRLNFFTAEDLVLVRLSCLARVQEEKDYLQLRAAWDALKARERAALTDHFLADGIEEQAFILEFLPNCVANSKANNTVGLTGLLGVLVDLLNNLRLSMDSMPDMEKVIPVDLSEMAEFIAVVQNRFVFLTCVSRCQLQFIGQRVHLKMTGGNWGRTTDPDSDMTSLAYTLQDILQKQEVLEAYIMRREEEGTKRPKRSSISLVRDYSWSSEMVRQEAF